MLLRNLATLRTEAERAARAVVGALHKLTRETGVHMRRAVRVSGALWVLARLETVLLSPSGRERIHATTTFALIFMLAVTSVDFLIGGAEFGSPARAAQPRSVIHASIINGPERSVAAEPSIRAAEPVAQVASAFAGVSEANVVAVSQTFALPALAPVSALETPASGELVLLSTPIDAVLAGAAPEEPELTAAALEPRASPRKGRVKDEHAARAEADRG